MNSLGDFSMYSAVQIVGALFVITVVAMIALMWADERD